MLFPNRVKVRTFAPVKTTNKFNRFLTDLSLRPTARDNQTK